MGGNGSDSLRGGNGNDTTVFGGDGNDTIYGDNNNNNIYGGSGDDFLWGTFADAAPALVVGGSGADKLRVEGNDAGRNPTVTLVLDASDYWHKGTETYQGNNDTVILHSGDYSSLSFNSSTTHVTIEKMHLADGARVTITGAQHNINSGNVGVKSLSKAMTAPQGASGAVSSSNVIDGDDTSTANLDAVRGFHHDDRAGTDEIITLKASSGTDTTAVTADSDIEYYGMDSSYQGVLPSPVATLILA